MIVPMKKIHLVVRHSDIPKALEELRNLKILHVEHQESVGGGHLNNLREQVALLERAVEALDAVKDHVNQEEVSDCYSKVQEINRELDEIDKLTEDMARRKVLIEYWQRWGNFIPDDIAGLKTRGIHVDLIAVEQKQELDLPEGAFAKEIFVADKKKHCVVISKGEVDIPFEKIKLPEFSLEQMKANQQKEADIIVRARERIKENAKYKECLKNELLKTEDNLRFEEVSTGMRRHEQDQLAILKGFCPTPNMQDFEKAANQQGWGVLIEESDDDDDQVPTLLKNPKWVELIKPVFKFVDILPGYKEVDVSVVFLIFFSIFFGILIGDAAYGLIFIALNAFFHIKLGKKLKDKTFFHLMYLLSTMTIIWGVLTGTYFGQAWLTNHVAPIVPWLTEMNNIIYLCFFIAAIHLSIARVWQIILLFPSLVFLAQFGWLAMVWTMFFAANMFVLNMPFPALGLALPFIGTILIIFFTKPNKNPLKAIGPGLADWAMNFINSFTDVVSYIRLFAVGLATVAVADAFNEMASGVGFGNVFTGFGAALILIAGHVLNMVLAGLAVLVHGIRLNVLEFPGHLNLEWGGISYNPFKRNEND